ncbi:MAG TPA: hypothetical protein VG675_09850 [Bryobacteraceae bacterium]|nr:hypothetical protein [Bryobacteraceae bacterium]
MAFRIEKRAGALVMGISLMAGASFAQQLQYEVWRGKSRVVNLPPRFKKVGNRGQLTVSDSGIAFEETGKDGKKPKHPQVWRWAYQDIQQLKISPKLLTVLTYKDTAWKFGADRQYDFDLVSEGSFAGSYELLKNRLDQRLVAEIPGKVAQPLWELPVKHLLRFAGDEGVLQVGADGIVYKSQRNGESRTWRYEDIENISTSGPFQLTITTFERAKTHYGDLKGFNFELKQRLDEGRFNELWLRLNQSKGLKILTSYRAGGSQAEK